MCNLNLLYGGAQLNGNLRLSTIATTHAETTMKITLEKTGRLIMSLYMTEKQEMQQESTLHKVILMNHHGQEVKHGEY